MPLMPMPPMPTKWIGPISRGSFIASPRSLSASCPAVCRQAVFFICSKQDVDGRDKLRRRRTLWSRTLSDPWDTLHHQISEPVGGIGRALRARGCAIATRLCGDEASAVISAARRAGVKSLLAAERIGTAALRLEHAGIGELVLVERARQRHQDRRPADGGKLRDTSTRPSATDDEMRGGDPRRQVGEERRHLRRRCEARRRASRTRARSSSRACCASNRRVRSEASSCSIAAGTISDMIRAPWLPPNTSSRTSPSASGRGERRRRRRDRGRPHRIAGARRLRGQRGLGIEHAGERRSRSR